MSMNYISLLQARPYSMAIYLLTVFIKVSQFCTL